MADGCAASRGCGIVCLVGRICQADGVESKSTRAKVF